jgi:hypothetical protein
MIDNYTIIPGNSSAVVGNLPSKLDNFITSVGNLNAIIDNLTRTKSTSQ